MIRPSPHERVRSRRPWFFGLCLVVSLPACESRNATAPEGAAPDAFTSSASTNMVPGWATLHGVVNPNGLTTETWFEWGSSAGMLKHQTSVHMVSGTTEQAVSATIESLEPATTYYYRVVARNTAGTRQGATSSFLTEAEPPVTDGFPLPNGSALVFVRAGNIYVHSVSEDGGELAQLTTGGAFGYPSWSPDGSKIAFVGEGVRRSRIFVVNADGEVRVIGYGNAPAWSPDGERLAFSDVTSGGNTAIFVKSLDDDPDSQPAVRIGFERGYHDFPAWSPDGTRIAFVSDWSAFDFAYEIYVANADGSGVTQVTDGFPGNRDHWPQYTSYWQPSWSPDGGSLALVACGEWQYTVCSESSVGVVAVDGSGFKLLAETTGFARPTWTSDGFAVVFSRTCWNHECPSQVFQVALDGGDERLVIADGHSGVLRP